MRNYITCYFIVLILCACKSENEKLLERVQPILRSRLIESVKPDSLYIDSLRIYRIDTLTPALDSGFVLSGLVESLEKSNYLNDLQNKITRNSIDKAKLYTVFGGDLLDMQKKDMQEEMEKGKKYLAISTQIYNRLRELQRLDSLKKIDSITPTGYIVNFKLKGADQVNKEIKIDSGAILLNNELRIVDRRSDVVNFYREMLSALQ